MSETSGQLREVMFFSQHELAKLHSTEKGLRWEPGTHELIPFPEWLASRVEGRPAEFRVPEGLYEWANAERGEVDFEVLPPMGSNTTS